MSGGKRTIYVGCGLTHASEDFRKFVFSFKANLRGGGYEVLEFKGLVDGTAEEVYRHDIEECAGKCDIFIGICDEPAIGLGYELAVAVEKRGIPTLAVAREGAKISRLVLGIKKGNYEFSRYSSLEDLTKIALDFIERLRL